MNPFNMDANKQCRRNYSKDMLPRSLDILNRTVMVATDPRHTSGQIDQMISNIDVAAKATFGQIALEEAEIKNTLTVDAQKFNLS